MEPAVDLTTGPGLSSSVKDLTEACLATFVHIKSMDLSKVDAELLQYRIADFRLWADGVGALAKSGLSLDQRFAHRPHDLTLVKNILVMLYRFLDDVASEVVNDGSPLLLGNVDSSIGNLAMIGMAIRRTGKASRRRRADNSFDPSQYPELRQHLECIVLLRPSGTQPRPEGLDGGSADVSVVSNLTQEPHTDDEIAATLEKLASDRMNEIASSKLSKLQNRLIEASLRRRHRFILAQRRSRKAEWQQPLLADKEPEKEQSAGITVEARVPQSGSQTATLNHRPKPQDMKRAMLSKASTAEQSMQYSVPGKDKRRSAPSQIFSVGADIDFPRPPREIPGRLVTKCPCCCQSLPADVITDPVAWRQHLVEDICPYTCVAEHCPEPYLTFVSHKEWMEHIEKDHPFEWKCLFCDEDVFFAVEEGMKDHIRDQHQAVLADYSPEEIVSWSAVKSMGIVACPLCASHGPKDLPELVDHVVRHAYGFALRALPWPNMEPEDLNRPVGTYDIPAQTEEAKMTENWILSTPPEIVTDSQASFLRSLANTVTAAPDATEDEDYFANNEYFREQNQVNSSIAQIEGASIGAHFEEYHRFGEWVFEELEVHRGTRFSEDGPVDTPYVPFDRLKEFWTIESINAFLWASLDHRRHVEILSAEEIQDKFLRIFTTLVYISDTPDQSRVPYLNSFAKQGLDDRHLPLENTDRLDGIVAGFGSSNNDRTSFYESQFLFTPHSVKETADGEPELKFRGEVLPISLVKMIQPADTTTSVEVALFRCHPSSGLKPRNDLVIAKMFPPEELEYAFANEQKVYTTVRSEYILTCFGSFIQCHRPVMLLEYADKGSLLRFFQENNPPKTRVELMNLWDCLSRLFDGLDALHNDRAYGPSDVTHVHQDLQPSNIFVFSDAAEVTEDPQYRLRFKIGDFGSSSAKTHTEKRNFYHNKTPTIYGAPELTDFDPVHPNLDTVYTTGSDIWSVGCVLLEVAVWSVGGEGGRRRFLADRTAETTNEHAAIPACASTFHNGKTMLQTVENRPKALRSQVRAYDTLTINLWGWICKHLLAPEPSHRLGAREAGRRMRQLINDARRLPHMRITRHPASSQDPEPGPVTSRQISFLNYISAYRLSSETLRVHLEKLFPQSVPITVTVVVEKTDGNSRWAVYLPRQLEKAEIQTIYDTLRLRRRERPR